MTTIKASCSDCGNINLMADEVHIRICEDTNAGDLAFRCPTCRVTNVKHLEVRVIDLLVASGVSWSTWRLPLELSEPKPAGNPIDHDDLLAFHDALTDGVTWELALAELDAELGDASSSR